MTGVRYQVSLRFFCGIAVKKIVIFRLTRINLDSEKNSFCNFK